MTRAFKGGLETALSEWLRKLDLKDVSIIDNDFFIEHYRVVLEDGNAIEEGAAEAPLQRTRRFKFQMNVEFKGYGAELTRSEHEQLYIAHQGVARQKKKGFTGKGEASTLDGEKVGVWYFGHYICRFIDASSPYGCSAIYWGRFRDSGKIDEIKISEATLKELFQFDIEPDELRPMWTVLRGHAPFREIEGIVESPLKLRMAFKYSGTTRGQIRDQAEKTGMSLEEVERRLDEDEEKRKAKK